MTDRDLWLVLSTMHAALLTQEKALSDAVHGHGSRFQSLETHREAMEEHIEAWEVVRELREAEEK